MKRYLLLLLIQPCLTVAMPRGTELTVRLNRAPVKGPAVLMLYDNPAAFADLRDPVCRVRFDSTELTTELDLPPGAYALAVFVDENENGTLDRNFIGIPGEAVGFANGYSPKGPPVFNRSAIQLQAGSRVNVQVELSRPLGPRGRIGAGLGVIGRAGPYRGTDAVDLLPIPVLAYAGERFQLLGLQAQYSLLRSGPVQMAVTARLRTGAYDEEDSPVFRGMGDRDTTLLAGLALRSDLYAGLNLELTAETDALDRVGGSEIALSINRPFQLGSIRLTPGAGVRRISSQFSAHDYGVSSSDARPDRPAYRPGALLIPEIKLSIRSELSERLQLITVLSLEHLPAAATDSPLVEDSFSVGGFAGLNYVF